MTIFDVLARQHQEIDALFHRIHDALTASQPALARETFRSLSNKLIACMCAKHAIVYPRFAFLAGLDSEVVQAQRGHERIEQAINHLRLRPLHPDAWRGAITRLQGLVTEHVETEEWILFPVARLRLTSEESHTIADEFLVHEVVTASVSEPSITYEPLSA